MEDFENRLLGITYGIFREQCNWEDYWRFSNTGYWGGHLEVFENMLMGIDLEIFNDSLWGRTFGIFS